VSEVKDDVEAAFCFVFLCCFFFFFFCLFLFPLCFSLSGSGLVWWLVGWLGGWFKIWAVSHWISYFMSLAFRNHHG